MTISHIPPLEMWLAHAQEKFTICEFFLMRLRSGAIVMSVKGIAPITGENHESGC